MRYRILFISAYCLLLASGCIQNEIEADGFAFEGQPQFGVPVAYSRVSAADAIDHFDSAAYVITDDNGALRLVYRSSATNLVVGDFLSLQDQHFSESIATPALSTGAGAGGEIHLTGEFLLEMSSPEGDRFDSLRLASGIFGVEIASDGPFAMSGEIQLRHADGMDVAVSLPISNQNPPLSFEGNTSLENALVTFVNAPGVDNGIRCFYSIYLIPQGPSGSSDLQLNLHLTQLQPRSAGGYIASRQIAVSDKGVNVTMFDSEPDFDLYIADPVLHFTLVNGLGLDVSADILEVRGFRPSGAMLAIEGANIQFNPFIPGASMPGLPSTTTITLDNSSSQPGISEFFSFQPNVVRSDLVFQLNPDNKPSVFVESQSELSVHLEADIPLFGSMANFSLTDTTEVTLGDLVAEADEMGYIESLDLRVIVDNGLPVEAGLQLVFCDSLYQPVDSLFDQLSYVLTSAIVNYTAVPHSTDFGRATEKTRTVIDVPVPRERIDLLANVRHMIVRVVGNTTTNGAQSVRIFAEDEVETRLGAKITVNYADL